MVAWYFIPICLVVGFIGGNIFYYFFRKKNPEDEKKVDDLVNKVK